MTDPDLDALKRLREPFSPNQIGKLPKGGMFLDFVGHAHLTSRLLDVDPTWTWEPFASDPGGLPAFDEHGGLWIRLTVCGVTRIGYGDAGGKRGGNAVKEAIGDALRNAAMRFGAALDLWAKGDLDAPAPPKPRTPADKARDELAAVAKRRKLDTRKLGERFAADYGMSVYDADAETISAFAKLVDEEAAVDGAAG